MLTPLLFFLPPLVECKRVFNDIKPDLEDNKAASYAKTVRGDTKELKQELTGESKKPSR